MFACKRHVVISTFGTVQGEAIVGNVRGQDNSQRRRVFRFVKHFRALAWAKKKMFNCTRHAHISKRFRLLLPYDGRVDEFRRLEFCRFVHTSPVTRSFSYRMLLLYYEKIKTIACLYIVSFYVCVYNTITWRLRVYIKCQERTDMGG